MYIYIHTAGRGGTRRLNLKPEALNPTPAPLNRKPSIIYLKSGHEGGVVGEALRASGMVSDEGVCSVDARVRALSHQP